MDVLVMTGNTVSHRRLRLAEGEPFHEVMQSLFEAGWTHLSIDRPRSFGGMQKFSYFLLPDEDE